MPTHDEYRPALPSGRQTGPRTRTGEVSGLCAEQATGVGHDTGGDCAALDESVSNDVRESGLLRQTLSLLSDTASFRRRPESRNRAAHYPLDPSFRWGDEYLGFVLKSEIRLLRRYEQSYPVQPNTTIRCVPPPFNSKSS